MNQITASNNAFRNARVLVIGAAGFIGRWVARRLSTNGAILTLAVRNTPAAVPIFARWGVKGEVVEVDLRQPGAGQLLVETHRPQVVFNLAGYGVDRRETEIALGRRINTELVVELAAALNNLDPAPLPGQQLVHAGSALEYGSVPGDLSESGPVEPIGWYGETKRAATQHLAAMRHRHGLRAITARLFTVYGPGEHAGRLLPSLLHASRAGAPLPLTAGTQRRDFTYVEDVAQGLLRLATLDACGMDVVNLATGKLHTVRRFSEIAAKALSIPDGNLRFGEIPQRGEEMVHDPVNINRLRSLVDWTPTTEILDGIRQTRQFEERPTND